MNIHAVPPSSPIIQRRGGARYAELDCLALTLPLKLGLSSNTDRERGGLKETFCQSILSNLSFEKFYLFIFPSLELDF